MGGAAIDWFVPCMRRMLGTAWSGMLELVKGTCDVAGHGEVDSAVVIVSLERDATVERAGPIACELG